MLVCFSKWRLAIFSLSLVAGLVLGDREPAIAEEPTVNSTPKQLIADLGAAQYEVRERAESQILTRGEEMLPELRQASLSPDPEVRMRAGTLLKRLTATLRLESFQRFLKNDPDVSLPGWDRFREQHGDTQDVRKLYVKMLEQEWDLIVTLETDPRMVDYLFYQRATRLRQRLYGTSQEPIRLGSAAAMLHAASLEDVPINPPSMEQIKFLLAAPDLSMSLQDIGSAPPVLSVFDHWLQTNLKIDRFSSEMRFVVLATCLRENIKSGVTIAKRLLEDRTVPLSFRGTGQHSPVNLDQQMIYALLAIAKLGSKEDINYVEMYFQDDSRLSNYLTPGDPFETQLRDVALVAAIHLSGENPKDFGFSRIMGDPNVLYNLRSIGFSTPVQRDAAFEKWQSAEYAKLTPK